MGAHIVEGKAAPRGGYPHVVRAGDFVFVSGTSARCADNSIAGADVDDMGTTRLDIRVQTRAVHLRVLDLVGRLTPRSPRGPEIRSARTGA